MHGAFLKLKMVSVWPECFSYLIIYKLYENDIYHLIITHEVCLCVMIFLFIYFLILF